MTDPGSISEFHRVTRAPPIVILSAEQGSHLGSLLLDIYILYICICLEAIYIYSIYIYSRMVKNNAVKRSSRR